MPRVDCVMIGEDRGAVLWVEVTDERRVNHEGFLMWGGGTPGSSLDFLPFIQRKRMDVMSWWVANGESEE
jgi:hypothetical protein